jgi:farnesol dehydrogenase
MKVFVTGATGFIGVPLTLKLARQGHTVVALYRSESKLDLIRHANIHFCRGHVLDRASLRAGLKDCDAVFHLAAHAKVWSGNPGEFYNINVQGTRNVLEEAREAGVKRVVITSTAGVFGPSENGKEINEHQAFPENYFTEYERTKSLADKEAEKFIRQGMDVVFLHPTRVYGPGQLSESNSVTKLIDQYKNGKWHIIPSDGKSVGNYVFVDDVVNGHINALGLGRPGERYLLGGENASYNEFFNVIKAVSGKAYGLYHLPYRIMFLSASVMEFLARLHLLTPLITKGFVRKYNFNWQTSSQKAVKELNYSVTSLEEGVSRTLKWIESSD